MDTMVPESSQLHKHQLGRAITLSLYSGFTEPMFDGISTMMVRPPSFGLNWASSPWACPGPLLLLSFRSRGGYIPSKISLHLQWVMGKLSWLEIDLNAGWKLPWEIKWRLSLGHKRQLIKEIRNHKLLWKPWQVFKRKA